MRYRLLYLGLGALLVAIVALTYAFAPEGVQATLPAPLEQVFPLPNNSVIRQTIIEADLEVGYDAVLFIDGFAVPPNEVAFADGINVYRWSPSPTSAIMAEWSPGDHTVRVDWVGTSGPPVSGTYEWTFRVQ